MSVASYGKMFTDVVKLKPQERKNFKGALANTAAQHTRAQHIEAGMEVPGYNCVPHFENKLSGHMQAGYGTEREWRVAIPHGASHGQH